MTESLTPNHNGHGSNGFSWADSTPVELPDEVTPEAVESSPVPSGTCDSCGTPIVRKPGSRGRLAKKCDDCKPATRVRIGSAVSRSTTNKERDADKIVSAFEGGVTKAAMLLSMADKYDAFVIMVQLPQAAHHLKATLVQHDDFRQWCLMMMSSGGLGGLIITGVMTALPIFAHHGLIPSEHLSKILAASPMTMFKLQQRLKDGTAELAKLMQEQLDAMQEQQRQQQAKKEPATSGV